MKAVHKVKNNKKYFKGDIGGPLICGKTICGINAYKICSNKSYRVFVKVHYHKLWLDKYEKDDVKKSSCCRNRIRFVILGFVSFIGKYFMHTM